MRGHRLTSTAAALLALALSAAAPAVAYANPILSGYGGPGQGNQAILGSALLNGPSGEGGSTGGGSTGGGSLTAETAGSRAIQARAAFASAGGRTDSKLRVGAVSGSGSHLTHPYQEASVLAASRGAGESQTLGLSGGDVAYMLVALGALALTAALTRRLARQPGYRGDAR
jgi:hypothetical protein